MAFILAHTSVGLGGGFLPKLGFFAVCAVVNYRLDGVLCIIESLVV
jgi:hypothetical protein